MDTNKEMLLTSAQKHLRLAIDEINRYANVDISNKVRTEIPRHLQEPSGHSIAQRLHV